MSIKLTTEEFINKAKAVHGNKYDYSKVNYKNRSTNVTIICPEHGEFEQRPGNHVYNRANCPDCSGNKKLTTEEFINKAKEIHGNKYDYSKANYKNSSTSITIICPEHGEFKQTAGNHIYTHTKNGCPECGGSKPLNTKKFIKRANAIHNNKYSYKKTKYVNNRTKVIITCSEHGEFEQGPHRHLVGDGCPKCGYIKKATDRINKHSLLFTDKAKVIHGSKYDYSKVNYTGNKNKVIIICPVHGEFEQTPDTHLYAKCGCPKCGNNSSNLESIVSKFFKENFPDIIVKERDRKVLSRCGLNNQPLELDFYLPEYNLAIEVHGNYWHSEANLEHEKARLHLYNKYKLCKERNIHLLQFYEDEIIEKFDVVSTIIKYKLNKVEERVYARKLKTEIIDKTKAKDFLDKYHLQGKTNSKEFYGLLDDNNKLYAVMAFSNTVSNRGTKADPTKWELTRFATLGNIVGGASKLLTAFINNHPECVELISYSDNRISNGHLYETLQFEIVRQVPVDYSYIKLNMLKRFHKSTLKKSNQAKLFTEENNCIPYDENLTEVENSNRNGYHRLWNAGLTKWSLT
ncbi:MAG: hypothetical protein [Bacteriophage sp.]|nr:MAG: hypothetical protein [Bacteriophage sp.]